MIWCENISEEEIFDIYDKEKILSLKLLIYFIGYTKLYIYIMSMMVKFMMDSKLKFDGTNYKGDKDTNNSLHSYSWGKSYPFISLSIYQYNGYLSMIRCSSKPQVWECEGRSGVDDHLKEQKTKN